MSIFRLVFIRVVFFIITTILTSSSSSSLSSSASSDGLLRGAPCRNSVNCAQNGQEQTVRPIIEGKVPLKSSSNGLPEFMGDTDSASDLIDDARALRNRIRKPKPLLPDIAGLIDCLARDISKSAYSVDWLEKTARVLPTVSRALSNATSGITNARNEVTDLYHWSPGNCNKTSAATWCYTAKQMISDGAKLEHATSSTRDSTMMFIRSGHTQKHVNTLMHEQNMYDALISAWHQPNFNFSDVRLRPWSPNIQVIFDEAKTLCDTSESRAKKRERQIRAERAIVDEAAVIETVASRYVSRAKQIVERFFVKPYDNETVSLNEICSSESETGTCSGCKTCTSCLKDPWCGWCETTQRCLTGDETGSLVFAAVQNANDRCDRWFHIGATSIQNQVCPGMPLPSRKEERVHDEPTIDDILHYIAPEDLSVDGNHRKNVHDSLTTWNRAMECERIRLEELDRRRREGKIWTYSDSDITWFEHNYTRFQQEEEKKGEEEKEDEVVSPPYCNDELLKRDIELSKASYGTETLGTLPSTDTPGQVSKEEEEIEKQAVERATLGRKPILEENEETQLAKSRVANMTRDAKAKVRSIEEEKSNNVDEDNSMTKNQKGGRRRGKKKPKTNKFGSFSKGGQGFDDGMKNDEIPDPNRIRITLSKGEFESLDQAKMYCEKNFDRLCTEKDMIQAYTKQRYRACTFGWYDSPNGYVDIGRGAAGARGGNDISACNDCGTAKQRKNIQRAIYLAKYPGRSVSRTPPTGIGDKCIAGGLFKTDRPQIEQAFCCGVPKVTPPEQFWKNAKCDGKEHEECSMDSRCCWYQPPMWRDRMGEGSSCQEKDSCEIKELNLEDPVIAERIRKEKKPPKCKRDFPNDVSDLRCDGMKQRKGPSSSEECQDACCRDMSCNVWQWCEAGHECSPESSCFLGPSGGNCTLETTVLRAGDDEKEKKIQNIMGLYPSSVIQKRRTNSDKKSKKTVREKMTTRNTLLLQNDEPRFRRSSRRYSKQGSLTNAECKGLGLEIKTEREIAEGMPLMIQYRSDCAAACASDISCGAWQWCDRELTSENMGNHCEPLGSCRIGHGISNRGPTRFGNCTKKFGLSGNTTGTNGIVGYAFDKPEARVHIKKKTSDDDEDDDEEEHTTTESIHTSTVDALDTVDHRVRMAISTSMKEILKRLDPSLEAKAVLSDEREGNVPTSAETGESMEEKEKEEEIHHKFCEKLARASTLAHTSRITSTEMMQNLRRSCASVRCVELMDVCIAIYSGKKMDTGHDVPGNQWRWHHL